MLGYPLTPAFQDGPVRAFIERQIKEREEGFLAGFETPDPAVVASSRSRLLQRSLPDGVAQALRSRCRAEGASVQGALGAALLAAGRDEVAAESSVRLPLVTAATLRRRLTEVGNEEVGLFSTGVRTVHRVDRSTNFWALAREIKRSVDDCIEAEEEVAALMLQREAVRIHGGPRSELCVFEQRRIARPSDARGRRHGARRARRRRDARDGPSGSRSRVNGRRALLVDLRASRPRGEPGDRGRVHSAQWNTS